MKVNFLIYSIDSYEGKKEAFIKFILYSGIITYIFKYRKYPYFMQFNSDMKFQKLFKQIALSVFGIFSINIFYSFYSIIKND